ncbi:MAG: PHP domain-containing protein, partial [candidate division NC10 bacterium]|nr:PHP domain-containing protein [candidate division NC10 bacterium]
MTYFADLHLHSTYSDGTFTPTEVVQKAHELGFSTISLTDHDTVAGLSEAFEAARDAGLELIPGVELSVDQDGSEVHILGYFIEWQDANFVKTLKELEAERLGRLEEILRRLKRLGFHLGREEVMAQNCHGTVGRLHVAQALVQKGLLPSVKEAFRLYLGNGRPAYVEKMGITLIEAIELIIKAEGIPV